MLNPPNSISFMRLPLALLFIIESVALRMSVIILAMLSDCIDGYLARRYHFTSRFGAVLDPLMDKFFVYIVLTVLLFEGKILTWQVATMLSRDFFFFLFLCYIATTKASKNFEIKAFLWGKITTAAQFCFLVAIVLNISFPSKLYYFFILIGCLAFIELMQFKKRLSSI